jgi:MFS family permease
VDPFKAVEESTVSLLSPLHDRSSIFAWYILFGMAGQAGGTILTGWAVEQFQSQLGWNSLEAYRVIFLSYAVLGLMKLLLCFFLSDKCERGKAQSTNDGQSEEDEQRPLLRSETPQDRYQSFCGPPTQPTSSSRLSTIIRIVVPQISRESWLILAQLCFLFALDSIASGLAPVSWMTLYFNRKFGSNEGVLGSALFVSSLFSSALNLVSSSLSRHIGLIQTMVLCHLPASITLAILPIPSSAVVAMVLLIFRMSTKDMDMAPRQAFVAAAVLEEERTAVMGVVNIVRTIMISIGPAVTGALAAKGRFWIAFVIAGCLKIAYNMIMLVMFWNYEPKEERDLKESLQHQHQAAESDTFAEG